MRKWMSGTGVLVALSLAVVSAGPAIACGAGGHVSEAHDTGEPPAPMEDQTQPQQDETRPMEDEPQPQQDQTRPQQDEPQGDESGAGAQGEPAEGESR